MYITLIPPDMDINIVDLHDFKRKLLPDTTQFWT